MPLRGNDVQQVGSVYGLGRANGRQQRFQVVAVDGAQVIETKLLEQRAGHHHAFDVLFPAAHEPPGPRIPLHHALAALADSGNRRAAHQATKHFGHAAHVRADGHGVFVQHHEHVRVDITAVVEGLEGHAGGHGAVADHRRHAPRLTGAVRGQGHAQAGADGSRRVTNAKSVIFTLRALRETAPGRPCA